MCLLVLGGEIPAPALLEADLWISAGRPLSLQSAFHLSSKILSQFNREMNSEDEWILVLRNTTCSQLRPLLHANVETSSASLQLSSNFPLRHNKNLQKFVFWLSLRMFPSLKILKTQVDMVQSNLL